MKSRGVHPERIPNDTTVSAEGTTDNVADVDVADGGRGGALGGAGTAWRSGSQEPSLQEGTWT